MQVASCLYGPCSHACEHLRDSYGPHLLAVSINLICSRSAAPVRSINQPLLLVVAVWRL